MDFTHEAYINGKWQRCVIVDEETVGQGYCRVETEHNGRYLHKRVKLRALPGAEADYADEPATFDDLPAWQQDQIDRHDAFQDRMDLYRREV